MGDMPLDNTTLRTVFDLNSLKASSMKLIYQIKEITPSNVLNE